MQYVVGYASWDLAGRPEGRAHAVDPRDRTIAVCGGFVDPSRSWPHDPAERCEGCVLVVRQPQDAAAVERVAS